MASCSRVNRLASMPSVCYLNGELHRTRGNLEGGDRTALLQIEKLIDEERSHAACSNDEEVGLGGHSVFGMQRMRYRTAVHLYTGASSPIPRLAKSLCQVGAQHTRYRVYHRGSVSQRTGTNPRLASLILKIRAGVQPCFSRELNLVVGVSFVEARMEGWASMPIEPRN